MKKIALTIALLCLASTAFAAQTATYGWEDGGTVLGTYGTILATNVSGPAHSGSKSLQLTDNYSGSSTPQAYVAWIQNLSENDVVTASFWVYDTTPGTSPSGRIWGHYNDSATDVNAYAGSASGNSDYGSGDGWSQLSYSWTIPAGHTGLIIEARTYSVDLDTVWVDDLSVTAPDYANIVLPNVPEPGSLLALASGIVALFGLRARKKAA